METIEIVFAVGLLILSVVSLGVLLRIKAYKEAEAKLKLERKEQAIRELQRVRTLKVNREHEENLAREQLRKHPNYTHPDFNPLNPSVLIQRTPVSSTTVSSYSRRSSPTVVSQPVFVDDSNDLLTAMILQNAINSRIDVTASAVQWNEDTPTITPVEVAPSYTAPEPERSSYSSSYSSSSDSSPSYSSSYSSSSSESSYSSSSSDYSSSSDSGSSYSSD
jgi:hypothetical protein